MRIVKERMLQQDVYNLLQKYDNTFTPPLSSDVNLSCHATKLYEHAEFIVCKDDVADIIAYIAYYKNEAKKQLYIPLICVSSDYQKKGIGTKMLEMLIDDYKENYTTVALEVVKNNTNALNFYIKQNFKKVEDRGKKILMVRHI